MDPNESFTLIWKLVGNSHAYALREKCPKNFALK
jgi:hypothetical protein